MSEKHRGIRIHFVDGTSISVSFPEQRDNQYAREILADEIMKRRMLTIEADGCLHWIPFENVKYFSLYPAPAEGAGKFVIRGATIEG